MRDPKLVDTVRLPTIEDAVKAGGFLAGCPVNITEALKAVEKRYPGLDRVICATPLGTPRLDGQLEDLDRFAKELIRPSATPGPPPPRRPSLPSVNVLVSQCTFDGESSHVSALGS